MNTEIMTRDNKYVPVPTNFQLGANEATAQWLKNQYKQAEKEELTAIARLFAMGVVFIEVRKQCRETRNFLKWVEENTEISQPHVYNCINLVEYKNDPRVLNAIGVREALKAIREINKEKQLAEMKLPQCGSLPAETSNVRSLPAETSNIGTLPETKWRIIYTSELETQNKVITSFVKNLDKLKTDQERLENIKDMSKACQRMLAELK